MSALWFFHHLNSSNSVQEKYRDTFVQNLVKKTCLFCPFGDFFNNCLAICEQLLHISVFASVWRLFNFYSILLGSLHNVSTSTPRRGSQSSITSPFSDTPRPAPKRQPATPTSTRRGSAPPRRPSGTSSSLMKGITITWFKRLTHWRIQDFPEEGAPTCYSS